MRSNMVLIAQGNQIVESFVSYSFVRPVMKLDVRASTHVADFW